MGTHPIFESDFDCLTNRYFKKCKTTKAVLSILTSPESAPPPTVSSEPRTSPLQINFCDVDPVTGRMLSTNQTFAICGALRRMGESDDSLYRLCRENKIAQ